MDFGRNKFLKKKIKIEVFKIRLSLEGKKNN